YRRSAMGDVRDEPSDLSGRPIHGSQGDAGGGAAGWGQAVTDLGFRHHPLAASDHRIRRRGDDDRRAHQHVRADLRTDRRWAGDGDDIARIPHLARAGAAQPARLCGGDLDGAVRLHSGDRVPADPHHVAQRQSLRSTPWLPPENGKDAFSGYSRCPWRYWRSLASIRYISRSTTRSRIIAAISSTGSAWSRTRQ